jgi:hypothetical protein
MAQNSSVSFSATIKNTGSNTIFLTGNSLSLFAPEVTIDDTYFLANAPASLTSGATWTGTVFLLGASATAASDSYNVSFAVYGGADSSAYNPLGAGQFQLAITTTFDQYKKAHFTAQELNDPATSGDNADPNHNGVANLLEYAFNLDPKAETTDPASLPTFYLDGLGTVAKSAGEPSAGRIATAPTFFALIYTKFLGAADLTYRVEKSTDLIQWEDASPTEVVLTEDGLIQRIEARVSLNGAKKLFLRLRVSR